MTVDPGLVAVVVGIVLTYSGILVHFCGQVTTTLKFLCEGLSENKAQCKECAPIVAILKQKVGL